MSAIALENVNVWIVAGKLAINQERKFMDFFRINVWMSRFPGRNSCIESFFDFAVLENDEVDI